MSGTTLFATTVLYGKEYLLSAHLDHAGCRWVLTAADLADELWVSEYCYLTLGLDGTNDAMRSGYKHVAYEVNGYVPGYCT